jgi:hypothetical protein
VCVCVLVCWWVGAMVGGRVGVWACRSTWIFSASTSGICSDRERLPGGGARAREWQRYLGIVGTVGTVSAEMAGMNRPSRGVRKPAAGPDTMGGEVELLVLRLVARARCLGLSRRWWWQKPCPRRPCTPWCRRKLPLARCRVCVQRLLLQHGRSAPPPANARFWALL